MILNELLSRQNVITKLVLQSGDKELSKELKVKIMRIRMAYNKVKKQYDLDVAEFAKQLVPEEFTDLQNKADRTEEETALMNEIGIKLDAEYAEYLIQKGNEEISENIDDVFTEEDFSEIVDINSGNDVEFNGVTVKAADFLEAVYELFVR